EGRVRYAYLGVLVGDAADVDPDKRPRAENGGKVESGAFVTEVTPGGPAATAGLQPGDVITDINGRKMETAGDVIDTVSTQAIGSRVEVGVLRAGKRQPVTVTLGELPSEDARAAAATGGAALGLGLQTLTPQIAQSMGLDPATRGAAVAEVAP